MGIYEDIKVLIEMVEQHGCFTPKQREASNRIAEWLNSPYCPLVDEDEEIQ